MAFKIFSLITFSILFCSLFLPVNAYNITKYNENESGLLPFGPLTYMDGTLAIYATKPINKTCVEPKFYIRIIYANGTIEIKTKTYPIPAFNFCKTVELDTINLSVNSLSPNYAVIIYVNSTDINSSTNNGILLSKNGEYLR